MSEDTDIIASLSRIVAAKNKEIERLKNIINEPEICGICEEETILLICADCYSKLDKEIEDGVSLASAYKICKASGQQLPKRVASCLNRGWVEGDFRAKDGKGLKPEALGIKNDFELTVDTSHYRGVHGREPEGQGSWVFSLGGPPQVEIGDFDQVRERVVKRAMVQGFHGEIVVRP